MILEGFSNLNGSVILCCLFGIHMAEIKVEDFLEPLGVTCVLVGLSQVLLSHLQCTDILAALNISFS